jgi:hypothetical protein
LKVDRSIACYNNPNPAHIGDTRDIGNGYMQIRKDGPVTTPPALYHDALNTATRTA